MSRCTVSRATPGASVGLHLGGPRLGKGLAAGLTPLQVVGDSPGVVGDAAQPPLCVEALGHGVGIESARRGVLDPGPSLGLPGSIERFPGSTEDFLALAEIEVRGTGHAVGNRGLQLGGVSGELRIELDRARGLAFPSPIHEPLEVIERVNRGQVARMGFAIARLGSQTRGVLPGLVEGEIDEIEPGLRIGRERAQTLRDFDERHAGQVLDRRQERLQSDVGLHEEARIESTCEGTRSIGNEAHHQARERTGQWQNDDHAQTVEEAVERDECELRIKLDERRSEASGGGEIRIQQEKGRRPR